VDALGLFCSERLDGQTGHALALMDVIDDRDLRCREICSPSNPRHLTNQSPFLLLQVRGPAASHAETSRSRDLGTRPRGLTASRRTSASPALHAACNYALPIDPATKMAQCGTANKEILDTTQNVLLGPGRPGLQPTDPTRFYFLRSAGGRIIVYGGGTGSNKGLLGDTLCLSVGRGGEAQWSVSNLHPSPPSPDTKPIPITDEILLAPMPPLVTGSTLEQKKRRSPLDSKSKTLALEGALHVQKA